jgi:hypothetical protein
MITEKISRRDAIRAMMGAALYYGSRAEEIQAQTTQETLPPEFWDSIASELKNHSRYNRTVLLDETSSLLELVANDASVLVDIDMQEVNVEANGSWTLKANALGETVTMNIANSDEIPGSITLLGYDAGSNFFKSAAISHAIEKNMENPNENVRQYLNKRFAPQGIIVSDVNFFLGPDFMRIGLSTG